MLNSFKSINLDIHKILILGISYILFVFTSLENELQNLYYMGIFNIDQAASVAFC